MTGNEKNITLLKKAVQTCARRIKDPAGRDIKALLEEDVERLCSTHGETYAAIYGAALKQGVLPYRYLRNLDSITPAMQLKLAESRVAVIGAGGLGGTVILLLARLGIGHIVVVDGDAFDETNLNRQALCRRENIGRPKTTEAAIAVGSVNPGIEVSAHQVKLDSDNGEEILAGTQVVVDGLDNVRDRFVVEHLTKDLDIPLVHGAVAGFEGQVMTIFPEDPGLELFYGTDDKKWQTKDRAGRQSENRPEAVFGVPALAPSLIATLQVMEVIKLLLKRGRPLRDRMLRVDLETGRFHEIVFKEV